jgi:hypothetical protein
MLSGKASQGEAPSGTGSAWRTPTSRKTALEVRQEKIGRPVGRFNAETEDLRKRLTGLEKLAGDQILTIRYYMTTEVGTEGRK